MVNTVQAAVAFDKKRILLEMAERGDARPNQKTPLGRAIANYTCSGSLAYDAGFDLEIRTIRPDWFGVAYVDHDETKQAILQIALRGETFRDGHPLYRKFENYIDPLNHRLYDYGFTAVTRLLVPEWFQRRKRKHFDFDATAIKQALRLAAEAGWERPERASRLGQALTAYSSERHRGYDPALSYRLIRLRPEWFGYEPVRKEAA